MSHFAYISLAKENLTATPNINEVEKYNPLTGSVTRLGTLWFTTTWYVF